MSDETKFSVMCSLFTWIQKSKTSKRKRSKFRKFLDAYCKPGDYFSAVRLILPSLDRERGSYGLKESVLATCLVDALGMSRDSEDAQRLFNWRKGGAKTGVNAGNFALVASEVLQRRQGLTSGGLTIRELNELLDRLASSENRAEKTSVLSQLIKKTNAQEMKWIIMIILKDLKLGVSEKSIFHEFHPDAEDLFNVTCDLKLVCEKLRDRNQRHKRQDIEVGKAVRPQLAMRVSNATAAWKKLHGKDVVVECKFDGDRIQIHKNGSVINFFSRNFLDHPEYLHSMSALLEKNVLAERCILDGEMLVWDTSTNRFAEFGSNQEIARAAKEGLDGHRQICYVAFDILYVGDTSVIHQSLKERHELLRKVIDPMKGRLEILIPNGGLNDRRPSGEPCWSFIAYNVDEVEKFFKETIENRDEGIVLKDLGSKWEPSDRSGKWLKLKPEYVRAGSDLDVIIIGGYYGSGRRGGEVAQFLVGLAERPAPDTYPRRFISFCRVGTGLSDEELDAVVTKLKPYFRKYEYPKKTPPSFYQVTNNSKERPDVWIESPEKSVILSITSDIRTIRSEVFAAPYSLRFPRIDRVRYDKPWHECLDVQSFIELVQSSNGTTQGSSFGAVQDSKPKRLKSLRKAEKQNVSVVPPHFVQTDISDVKGETLIFSRMIFYFVNVPPTHSLDTLHKVVAENGGTFSMNLNKSVTHCIAAESKGIKFQAAKGSGDVIHYSWLLDCCSQKKLLPLQPKYFMHISDSSKRKLQEEIDEFSDPYYWDLDIEDMKQLLGNLERSKDSKRIDYYKRKLCPKDKWSYLHGCCICFHPVEALCADAVVLTDLMLRRMKFEVTMGGGEVRMNLSEASHLVIISPLGLDVDFNTVLRSFSSADVRVIQKKNLHVVGYRWLEECSEKEQKLEEEKYSFKPTGLQELNSGEWMQDPSFNDLSHINNTDPQGLRSSPSDAGRVRVRQITASSLPRVANSAERGGKRKRGRPTTSVDSGKRTNFVQPRGKRAHIRSKLARINEFDLNASSDEHDVDEVSDIGRGNHEIENVAGKECLDISDKTVEGFNPSPKQSVLKQQVSDEAHETRSVGGNNNDVANAEKLEVMVDPVQSMLLDMIPSLGRTKGNIASQPSVLLNQKPAEGCVVEPVKKRKVSYKDMAAELLKD